MEPEAEKEIKGEDGHVQDGWMDGKNGCTAFFRILYRQLNYIHRHYFLYQVNGFNNNDTKR